jgi:peroxiredoxin Q/BCP
MLKEGEDAPSFELEDHTGKTTKLSDFAGQNVLLWFYPEADTPG